MTALEPTDTTSVSLARLLPTDSQRRFVLTLIAIQFVGLGIAAPLASIQLPEVGAFIPVLEGILFINNLITSVWLFAQYSIAPSRPLLALACGYLFTALIIVAHLLTFPRLFSPTGLLGAGLQSTAWLYYSWHCGLPAALVAYVLLKGNQSQTNNNSTRAIIGWSVAIVIALVCSITWVATAGDPYLPAIVLSDTVHANRMTVVAISSFVLLLSMIALVFLWIRRNTLLDYWLMLAAGTSISEMMLTSILHSGRFMFGWYAGRGFSLITSVAVLILMLEETTKLYARVARSNAMLQRERNNKLLSLEASVASISHELRQPLTAIGANTSAALTFLEHARPDLDATKSALSDVASDVERLSNTLTGLRRLFGKGDKKNEPINMNEAVLDVLRGLRSELKEHDVTLDVDLEPQLPFVMGFGAQLQEIITNLVHNATEAMDAVKPEGRVLRVRSKADGTKAIVLEVEDSGPGVDPERVDGIFGAFVTTKPHGTGLGLAISRLIAEQHGGDLFVSANDKTGAVFKLILPIA
jgi:signal transduction histidine kinase